MLQDHRLRELTWLNQLLNESKVECLPVFRVDNQSAIKIIRNPVFHKRSKHIEVHFHYLREKFNNGDLIVHYISTSEQTADIFTKSLPVVKFVKFRIMLNVLDKTFSERVIRGSVRI